MISAGIDIGAKAVKAVVVRAEAGQLDVIGRASGDAGFEPAAVARAVLAAACERAAVCRDDVARVVASGAGREEAPDKDRTITEVSAAARGALHLCPGARTVVDVGAEEGRAILTSEAGKVIDFAVNEKCAAGAGAFTEAMARALELSLEELGRISLESTQAISINAQCVVFAESEVVSMIHSNVPRADMARAVHDGIAARIISMLRKVGYVSPVALVGGLARNVGFVDSLRRGLEIERLEIPEHPEHCVALGAALVAADQAAG